MAGKVDLHIHSAASDGTDAPLELIVRVRAAGIGVFALTDHDTAEGVGELAGELPEGIAFIPGIEFSCRAAAGKCHILGYGCDTENGIFREALAQGRALRQRKLELRLEFLAARGFSFSEEELASLRRLNSAGKPHLGELMAKHGYAASKEDAIRDVLNLCPGEDDRIGAETAVRAILAAGGIPVWAHPMGGEGEKALGREEFGALLDELLSCGVLGLECWYSRYPPERCRWLENVAGGHGLLISGGSDYHGKNKDIPLGTLNAGGEEVAPDCLTVLEAFRERGLLRRH